MLQLVFLKSKLEEPILIPKARTYTALGGFEDFAGVRAEFGTPTRVVLDRGHARSPRSSTIWHIRNQCLLALHQIRAGTT